MTTIIYKGLKIVFVTTFTGLSVLAAASVPYYTSRSIFAIITRESAFTFEEMLHSGNVVFYIIAPPAAALATLAVMPFNIYNSYKFSKDARIVCCDSAISLVKTILSIPMLVTGTINGYLMGLAWDDLIPGDSIAKQVIKYPIIVNGTFFAGLADARTLSSYLFSEMPRDLRLLGRAITYPIKLCCKNRQSNSCCFFRSRDRAKMLCNIRNALDKLAIIYQLGMSDEQLEQFGASLVGGLSVADQEKVTEYFSKLELGIPKWRFFGSEIVGSILSAVWAYFGNLNTREFANKAVTALLVFLGLDEESWITTILSKSFSWLAYAYGGLVSFYLIRDLFVREIVKSKVCCGLADIFKRIILPLVPAFSYGLINIILTFMNESLGPAEIIIVSLATVIGATVLSRYGIDGGMRELRGQQDWRKVLAAFGDKLMRQYRAMNPEELCTAYEKIRPFIEGIDNMGADVKLLDIQQRM